MFSTTVYQPSGSGDYVVRVDLTAPVGNLGPGDWIEYREIGDNGLCLWSYSALFMANASDELLRGARTAATAALYPIEREAS